mgnify:CR=1 FL=1
MPLYARLLLLVPCLVLGAVVSLCTVLLHGYWWGLVLGVATTAAVLVALPGGWWSRLPAALGWVGVLALAGTERPEGDLLVTADVRGYALLVVGGIVLVSGFVGLIRRASATDDAERSRLPT